MTSKNTKTRKMIEEIIYPENWIFPTALQVFERMQTEKESQKPDNRQKPNIWKNTKNALSPLTTYKFLKAKFGEPNGFIMLLKNNTSDNLIHWQFTFWYKDIEIHFFGHTSGLEIMVKSGDLKFKEEDWNLFIISLKASFGKYGKEMSKVQDKFEKWDLFINPFSRLHQTITDLIGELEALDLTEVIEYDIKFTSKELNNYHQSLELWISNITKASTLGTTIRMLFPVLVEAFINLLILLLRKKEYKDDSRLYDNLIRQQIDIRVKSLHLACDGFTNAVDGNDERFKNFHTLMNRRNDFLHGNIDPVKLFVENVFFDNKTIPLFDKDEGMIKRMMGKYTLSVERDEVLKDELIVNEFMALVLCSLDRDILYQLLRIMDERFPGMNSKTGRMGVLFPNMFVEGHSVRGEEDPRTDPNLKKFIDNDGTFEVYIPLGWKYFIQNERIHTFIEYELWKSDTFMISISNLKTEAEKKRFDKLLRSLSSASTTSNSYYSLQDKVSKEFTVKGWTGLADDKAVTFSYTYPNEVDPELDNRDISSKIRTVTSVIETFRLINPEDKPNEMKSYRFDAFLRGLGATALILSRAIENKAFIEATCILANQIDALLRTGIILKNQLINKSSEIDLEWIYQGERDRKKMEKDIYKKALELEIIDGGLNDELYKLYDDRNRVVHRFIISEITLAKVEEIAYEYYKMRQKVTTIVYNIESEQIKLGVGMTRLDTESKFDDPLDYIKGKISKLSYFDEKENKKVEK